MKQGTSWLIAATIAGAAYPIMPVALYAMAKMKTDPGIHAALIAAGLAVVFAVPLAGVVLLCVSAGTSEVAELRTRAAGILLVLAPALLVLSRVLASVAGFRASLAVPVWFGFWTLVTIGIVWRSATPRSLLPSSVSRGLRVMHRLIFAFVLLFIAAHLAVNLMALRDLAAYNLAAAWLRLAYRTPAGEPLLLALLALQMGSGLALALDTGISRTSFEHVCQVAAGLFIAAFLTSHTLAVAVLGRGWLDRGPMFAFASAGPGGLLSSAQGAALLPYYGLSVVSLTVHLARPIGLNVLRKAGAAPARVAVAVLICLGVVISALLLVALVTPPSR